MSPDRPFVPAPSAPPPASRRRWSAMAAMALAVVVVAAACGGDDSGSKAAPGAAQPFEFSGNAATLDGQAIPAQVLADQIDAFRKAPEAAQTALHVDQLYQDNSDQPAPEVVSDLLTTEIAVKAIDAELATRGLSATDANRDVASVQVKASFGSTADKLPPTFVQQTIDRYANFVALDQALAVQPTEDEIAKQYAAHPDEYQRACVRHILLANEADANAVLDQLRAGADFATVAAAKTTDVDGKTDGGALGCVAKGSFTDDFEKAVWDSPVGDYSGPVKSEFGFHVLQVTKRGLATLDEVHDDIKAEIGPAPFQSLGIWLQVHLAKATVDVDPRFGVWESLTGQVLPRGTSSKGLSMTPQNPADSGNGGASSTTAGPAAPATSGPATTAPSPLLGALSPQTTDGSSPTTTGG